MDLQVSINFSVSIRGFVGLHHFNLGVSNGILGLEFLLPKFGLETVPFTLGRGWISGFPPISTAPMARNTENPRFFKDGCWSKEHSPANSMIFVDLRVSTNIGVSNGKLWIDFLLPNFAYQMCHLHQAAGVPFPPPFPRLRWPETRKIQEIR